jgi:hypothetical protein
MASRSSGEFTVMVQMVFFPAAANGAATAITATTRAGIARMRRLSSRASERDASRGPKCRSVGAYSVRMGSAA